MQPQHTPEGYTIQFECKVEGSPRPQITWFRQTQIIKPSPDFQMYYDDDNVATLIIREVFQEDAGTFTCVAKNAAGFASNTTELLVEAQSSEHGSEATAISRKSMSRESSLADILEGIPPIFSRKPRAQCVDEKANVVLECRLVAVPEPEITWYYNDEKVVPENVENIKVVTESDMHMYCSVLNIKKVMKHQEGVYKVVATNREGESILPIILKVKTGQKEKPEILEPLRNTVIREGETIILSTPIVGNPLPEVVWLKNGQALTGISQVNNDVYSLTIVSPTSKDTGEYLLRATNSVGTAESKAFMTVEGTLILFHRFILLYNINHFHLFF